MSESKNNDTNLPILVLVRRGRKGRGYLVSAIDDPTNAAACTDSEEVGQSIVEMLDDPEQPRCDLADLESATTESGNQQGSNAAGAAKGGEIDGYDGENDEDEEEEEEGEEDWVDSYTGDPLERLLLRAGQRVLSKGREMSNSYRKTGSKVKGKR